jgi:hypothetical protein
LASTKTKRKRNNGGSKEGEGGEEGDLKKTKK